MQQSRLSRGRAVAWRYWAGFHWDWFFCVVLDLCDIGSKCGSFIRLTGKTGRAVSCLQKNWIARVGCVCELFTEPPCLLSQVFIRKLLLGADHDDATTRRKWTLSRKLKNGVSQLLTTCCETSYWNLLTGFAYVWQDDTETATNDDEEDSGNFSEEDQQLRNAATIGTALMVVNSHRALSWLYVHLFSLWSPCILLSNEITDLSFW